MTIKDLMVPTCRHSDITEENGSIPLEPVDSFSLTPPNKPRTNNYITMRAIIQRVKSASVSGTCRTLCSGSSTGLGSTGCV